MDTVVVVVAVVVAGRTGLCSYAVVVVQLADVVAVDAVRVGVSAVLSYWNFHPNRPSRLPSRHCCCYCW